MLNTELWGFKSSSSTSSKCVALRCIYFKLVNLLHLMFLCDAAARSSAVFIYGKINKKVRMWTWEVSYQQQRYPEKVTVLYILGFRPIATSCKKSPPPPPCISTAVVLLLLQPPASPDGAWNRHTNPCLWGPLLDQRFQTSSGSAHPSDRLAVK